MRASNFDQKTYSPYIDPNHSSSSAEAATITNSAIHAPALPSDWTHAVDPASGNVYYKRGGSLHTQWSRPLPLRCGWAEVINPKTQQLHYYNSVTKKTLNARQRPEQEPSNRSHSIEAAVPTINMELVLDGDKDVIQCYAEIHKKYGLIPLSKNRFEKERSWPGRAITDMSDNNDMEMFDFHETAIRMKDWSKMDDEERERSFPTNPGQVVQPVGYSTAGRPPRSTWTNIPNRLTFTDGQGDCIGAVVGGENIQHGMTLPGGIVGTIHFGPKNTHIKETLRAAIEMMLDFNLTPVLAYSGGSMENKDSVRLAQDLLSVADEFGIEPRYDETCEDRIDDSMTGGYLNAEHRVVLVNSMTKPHFEGRS